MNKKLTIAMMICATMLVVPSYKVEASDTYIKQEYQNYVYDIAQDYGICPELIISIIERESRGQAGVSNGSCKGLMQINERFQKDRMKRLGVTDLYDPRGNILVGIDYIMSMAEEYEDIAEVLMHYHGEKNVESKIAQNKISRYATSILDRSAELERLHYGL